VLFQPQLFLDTRLIGLVDQCGVRQPELSLVRLLGQDMAFECVLSLDLSGTRQLETLLGTGFGLHFRHLFLVKY
jgi:hypothetical protein